MKFKFRLFDKKPLKVFKLASLLLPFSVISDVSKFFSVIF